MDPRPVTSKMNLSSALFVFTRDAPARLRVTLSAIPRSAYPTYIVDDSSGEVNRALVVQACEDYGCSYLGLPQYREFLRRSGMMESQFPFLLREPGFPEWNLGYMRNYALLFACSARYERVLYIDDDIRVTDQCQIDDVFDRLDRTSFVGARVIGQRDDSILGHIAADVGVQNPELLSGGFLAFRPAAATSYFFNVYNEDWIWLLSQLGSRAYEQHGTVVQGSMDPFERFEERILFQEYGELIVDGLLEVRAMSTDGLLESIEFWNRMIFERTLYLDDLHARANERGNANYVAILNFLIKNRPVISAAHLRDLFTRGSHERVRFLGLVASLI